MTSSSEFDLTIIHCFIKLSTVNFPLKNHNPLTVNIAITEKRYNFYRDSLFFTEKVNIITIYCCFKTNRSKQV